MSQELDTLAPIGIEEIDSEHALQFKLLEGFDDAVSVGDREAALQMLTRLHDFSDAHFGSEQVLMRFHSYPGYAAHEREHGELLEELWRMTELTRSSALDELPIRSREIRRWLLAHINSSDRAFGSFLRREGPGPIAAPRPV
jgi:hemerythrin